MSDGLRLGDGVLTATPGSSARQTRGKGTLMGWHKVFKNPPGSETPLKLWQCKMVKILTHYYGKIVE